MLFAARPNNSDLTHDDASHTLQTRIQKLEWTERDWTLVDRNNSALGTQGLRVGVKHRQKRKVSMLNRKDGFIFRGTERCLSISVTMPIAEIQKPRDARVTTFR